MGSGTVPRVGLGDPAERVEILRIVGRGSTGTVYEVRTPSAETALALKVVTEPTWSGLRRRESDVLQGLRHDHLVTVYGTAQADVGTGLLMELLPGGSVERLVASSGPLTPGQAVTVLGPIAEALDYLHHRDVTHGDISPANVLFTASGMPKLTDFGLAGLLGRPGVAGRSSGFAAPELMADPDAAAGPGQDVYAWGAVAWYVLTGRPPGPTATRPPLPSLVPEIGAGVAGLIEAALSEDAAQRPSAAEAHAGIFDAGTPEPVDLVHAVDEIGLSRLVTQMPAAARPPSRPWSALRSGGRAAQSPMFRPGHPTGGRSRAPGSIRVGAAPEDWSPWLRRLALGMTALCLVAAALLIGGALLADGPGRSPAADVVAGSSSAAPAVSEAPSGATGRDSGSTPLSGVEPEDALVRLAGERDAALEMADAERLERVYAGSDAAARDRETIAQLIEGELRYSGLETSLSGVRLVARDAREATVEAWAAVGPYSVATVHGETVESVPAGEPSRVVMEMEWEPEGGWRISGVHEGPPQKS